MKVLLAMSGGVDSSAAGAILLAEGHAVVGVTMKLWGGDSDTGCCSVSDVDDARRVAQQLGIDHLVFNFGDDFNEHVVGPYVRDHAVGVTPNPCIECNRHLKFDRLLQRADQLGFDAIATGHHARIGRTADGAYTLERGADAAKDQSYVVHMLDQSTLQRTMFPVGSLEKSEVRRLAAESGLRTADKPDSQDVCFITSQGRETFLGHRIELRPARVIDTDGAELGSVDAVEMVTIGQRRGIGLPGGGPKRYVVDVDVPGRTVVVGDERDLLDESTVAVAPTWVGQRHDGPVLVQASAHGRPVPAVIGPDQGDQQRGGALRIAWQSPQRRIAPGQSVVFYDLADRCVIGGATVVASR